MVRAPQVPSMIRKFAAAKKKALTNNSFAQVASPGTPRTLNAGTKNSNGPKGGSSKSSVPANRTYLKTNNKGKPAKVRKVTKKKLNTVPTTPFNRSSRVNYRQLRGK